MARGRDPDRAARARPLGRGPVRRLLDVRRRAVVAGAGRGRAAGDRADAARVASCRWRVASTATARTSAPTDGSRWERSSRSSGRPGATASTEPTCSATRSTRRARRRTAAVCEIFRVAHAGAVGRGSPPSPRLLSGARAGARRGAGVGARPGAGDGRHAGSAGRRRGPCGCWGCRSSSAARRETRPARPDRRSASTPTRCWPRPASAPPRSRGCTQQGAVAGTATGAGATFMSG